MPTIYQAVLSGTITDNPLASGATSFNSTQLASMLAVAAPNTMWVLLDPDGVNGAPEIVQVTAHTAATTVATIARGQQIAAGGGAARVHPFGTAWAAAVTPDDLPPLWVDVIAANVVLNQAGAAVAKTIGYAAYRKVGTNVQWQGVATITGAGTAGGLVQLGLPFPARAVAVGMIRPIGTCILFNQSAGAYHKGLAAPVASASLANFLATNTLSANYLGAIDFTEAFAASDSLAWDITYEAAA